MFYQLNRTTVRIMLGRDSYSQESATTFCSNNSTTSGRFVTAMTQSLIILRKDQQSASQAGRNRVSLKVTDGQGGSASESFTIQVANS